MIFLLWLLWLVPTYAQVLDSLGASDIQVLMNDTRMVYTLYDGNVTDWSGYVQSILDFNVTSPWQPTTCQWAWGYETSRMQLLLNGTSVEMTFNGTRIEIYYFSSEEHGRANVFLDGEPVGGDTFDTYEELFRSECDVDGYTISGLSEQQHTIRITRDEDDEYPPWLSSFIYTSWQNETATTATMTQSATGSTTSWAIATNTSSSSGSKNNTPLIAGLTAGLASLALISVLLLCLWRRRHRGGAQPVENTSTRPVLDDKDQSDFTVHPFNWLGPVRRNSGDAESHSEAPTTNGQTSQTSPTIAKINPFLTPRSSRAPNHQELAASDTDARSESAATSSQRPPSPPFITSPIANEKRSSFAGIARAPEASITNSALNGRLAPPSLMPKLPVPLQLPARSSERLSVPPTESSKEKAPIRDEETLPPAEVAELIRRLMESGVGGEEMNAVIRVLTGSGAQGSSSEAAEPPGQSVKEHLSRKEQELLSTGNQQSRGEGGSQ